MTFEMTQPLDLETFGLDLETNDLEMHDLDLFDWAEVTLGQAGAIGD